MDSAVRVSEEVYQAGDLCIDVGRHRVTRDGLEIPLPNLSFDLLLALAKAHPRMMTTDELLDSVWSPAVVNPETVAQRVKLLRQALGEDARAPRYVVGVRGLGYRMDVPVTRIERDSSQSGPGGQQPRSASAPAAPETPPAHSVTERSSRVEASAREGSLSSFRASQRHLGKQLWALGVALVSAGAVWYGTHRPAAVRETSNPESVEHIPVGKLRLAVMPFENLSPDPNNAFFADGLHEEIVSTLAERVPGIEVISRTTMMSYRASPPKSLAVVARELSASHLIEGSVRREGNRVRLTVQLIDARADTHIWSASYDRTLADTLALESEVAQEIAKQLSARLSGAQRADSLPVLDTEAFDLYLKAVLALRTFYGSPAEFHRIEDLLSHVIARQPGFALAYAQRARARTLDFISSRDTRDEFVTQIRTDLATAQRLAPRDPFVLAATGYFLMCTNDTSGALQAYSEAEAAGLQDSEWLIPKAHLLLRRSRIDELNATVQRMLSLDPADPLTIDFAAYNYFYSRQPSNALRALSYARDAFPSLYARWRGYVFLDYAGRTGELRSFVEQYEPATDAQRITDSLPDYFLLLRYEHRYAELRTHIDRVPLAASNFLNGVNFGPIGPTPTALFRGWSDLLLGDRAAAAEDGRLVLQFVQHQRRTPWNAAHLEALAAAGYTFRADCARARAASDASLGLVSRADDAVVWTHAAVRAAYVAAWCGAPSEAVSLLRDLTRSRPGIGPASAARDPLFTVPLGSNAAFNELRGQLEAMIRATRLEPDDDATD